VFTAFVFTAVVLRRSIWQEKINQHREYSGELVITRDCAFTSNYRPRQDSFGSLSLLENCNIMGLLKHIILPLFVVFHSVPVYLVFSGQKEVLPSLALAQWPPNADTDAPPLSPLESHLLGALGGAHLALVFNCLVGILYENSHYRGMVAVVELIFFAGVWYDAYLTGYPTEALMIVIIVAAAGLLVHVMEPGIFTKDKSKTKSS
jgi:hypothetical protein